MSTSHMSAWLDRRAVFQLEVLGILCLLSGAIATIIEPLAGALIFVLGLVVLFLKLTPTHAILLVLWLLPFDLERSVAGHWVYLDLFYLLLAFVLVRVKRDGLAWWVWAPYLFWVFASGAPRAVNPYWYYGFLVRLVIAVLLYAVAVVSDVGERGVIALGLTTIPVTLYGLYQLTIHGLGGLYLWLNPHMERPWTERAYGLFWHENCLGGYCAIALAMNFALLCSGYRHRMLKWIIGAASVGVVSSGSRGALLSALVAIVLVCLVRKRYKALIALGCTISGAVVTVLLFNLSFIERLLQAHPSSTVISRILIDSYGMDLFLAHPIWGIGVTNFAPLMPQLFNYYFNPIQVQNLFIQQLAESGIVGLVLFWTPVIFLARWLWRFRADGLALAGVALLVTLSGHGLVDDLFAFTPQYLFLVFAMLGIVTSRVNFLRRYARFSYSLPDPTRARSASSRPLTARRSDGALGIYRRANHRSLYHAEMSAYHGC
jgi:O-Antigen ligase